MPEDEELYDSDIELLQDRKQDLERLFKEPLKILESWEAKTSSLKELDHDQYDMSDFSQDQNETERKLEESIRLIFEPQDPAATYKGDGSFVWGTGSLKNLTWGKKDINPSTQIEESQTYNPGSSCFLRHCLGIRVSVPQAVRENPSINLTSPATTPRCL